MQKWGLSYYFVVIDTEIGTMGIERGEGSCYRKGFKTVTGTPSFMVAGNGKLA